jgi:membrane protein DedA with SNARE-associated domain
MSLETWIAHYGYVATFLGGMVESETVVLLAGLAAHRGLLDVPGVIAAAALGTLSANQLLFHVGRLRGHVLLARFPRLKPRAARVLEFAHRHQHTLVLLYHFSVGIRAMTPFVLGMSRVRPVRFALLDTTVTVLWTSTLAVAGFWLGDALESWLPELERVEHLVVAALFGIGVLGWLARRLWYRWRPRSGG